MSLTRSDFDQISESDLSSLVHSGVAEGVLYEFKSGRYGGGDADVKEFLKDVSSFANSSGGHLVIGIEETEGVASKLAPLSGFDPDQEILRLENLMRDGIEPRVSGTRIKIVPIAAGGFCIVVRILRSWKPPHRVSIRNTNRFYIRNSAGAHEVSVEELRVLFNVAATSHDRIRAFRQERLAMISANEGSMPLSEERGKLIIHLVPLSAFAETNQVDLQKANESQNRLHPILSQGHSTRFNFDGLLTYRGGDKCHGYTQLFRNGCIEATKVRTVISREGVWLIPTITFGDSIFGVLPPYLEVIRNLDVSPPIILMITLTDVRGCYLGISNNQWFEDNPSPISQSVLELPEILIEDFGTEFEYHRAIRPAFDVLWNAAGYASCTQFNSDGRWVRPR